MPLDAGRTSTASYAGVNFAPVAPLMDAKRSMAKPKDNPSSINAFFREHWQEKWSAYEEAWEEITQQGQVISLLRSGKLIMKRDLAGTGYVFLKRQQTQDRTNYPLFAQNSEILSAKWAKVQVGVRARHFGDGYKVGLQLNQIDTMVKSYFRDIFTKEYEDREAASAQDYGTYITQFRYDHTLDQMMQIAPVIQRESKVLVPGYGACYDCGLEGHPDDFGKTGATMPQCPECKSFRTTNMVPDAVSEEAMITDVEQITQGDITGRLLDFPACRYDPRVFAHESSYFLYSERVPIRLLRASLGDEIDIAESDASEMCFRVMDSLAARGGNTENSGETDFFGTYDRFSKTATQRSMWLKPEEYAGFRLSKAEKTLGGAIPANVDWAELFPKGIEIRGFDDMRLQTAIIGEKANIASQVYLYQSHSGHGKGVSDAVEVAKDLNEVFSMAMAQVKRHGAGGLAIAKNSGITPKNVKQLFKPQGAVFVETENFGYDINKVIQKIAVDPVNAALPQTIISLTNLLNMAFMTGDFSQGTVQEVNIDTLGGQQLASAKAEAQKGGIWGRKTSHRIQAAEIITDIFRCHIQLPKYYANGQDNHSTIRGKFISGADLPEKIKFDAVPDSEIPENKFEKRIARQEMVEKAGGILALAQASAADPRMTAWYVEAFGQELPTLDHEEVQLVCLARLSNIHDLSEMFGDPEQILASLDTKLRVGESGHILKSQFLQEVLDDDEIQGWNPLAQATVELLIERHLELQMEFQLRDQMRQVRAQIAVESEMAAAQQAMMQPQIDAQNAAAQEEATAGALMEVGDRVLDDEADAAKTEREMAVAEEDEARQNRMADRQLQRDIDLEEAKAASRPAPQKKGKAAAK